MHGSQPTVNLDLVAIGTITDIMSLTGENRVIVRIGLRQLAHTKRQGLAALLAASKIKEVPCPHGLGGICRAVTAEQIAFVVGPSINAIGRMEIDPANAIQLMLTKDPAEAAELARLLTKTNGLRKERTNKLVDDALATIVPDVPVIVYQAEIFKGLAGLVANRLVSTFARPVIVIDEGGAGSARSIEGFDLLSALQTDFSDLVVAAGHGQAMGISGLRDIDALRRRVADYDWPFEVDRRSVRVDAVCLLSDLNYELMDSLTKLEPTGRGNEKAIVAVSGAQVTSVRPFGKDGRHVLFGLRDSSGETRDAKWFGHAADAPAIGSAVDVVGRPSLQRDWHDGLDYVQIEVEDVRPTVTQLPPTIT
jgi:single-stranded-DNA-specific exonuclease